MKEIALKNTKYKYRFIDYCTDKGMSFLNKVDLNQSAGLRSQANLLKVYPIQITLLSLQFFSFIFS